MIWKCYSSAMKQNAEYGFPCWLAVFASHQIVFRNMDSLMPYSKFPYLRFSKSTCMYMKGPGRKSDINFARINCKLWMNYQTITMNLQFIRAWSFEGNKWRNRSIIDSFWHKLCLVETFKHTNHIYKHMYHWMSSWPSCNDFVMVYLYVDLLLPVHILEQLCTFIHFWYKAQLSKLIWKFLRKKLF